MPPPLKQKSTVHLNLGSPKKSLKDSRDVGSPLETHKKTMVMNIPVKRNSD